MDLHSKILDARPPLGVKILSISCSFWENLAKLCVGAPPGELAPPPRGNPGSATVSGCVVSFAVLVMDGYFNKDAGRRTGWTHVVLNYLGPNNGQGIEIYYNGVRKKTKSLKNTRSYSAGDGRIVVGWHYTNFDRLYYASMQIDELLFFNRALTAAEISNCYLIS